MLSILPFFGSLPVSDRLRLRSPFTHRFAHAAAPRFRLSYAFSLAHTRFCYAVRSRLTCVLHVFYGFYRARSCVHTGCTFFTVFTTPFNFFLLFTTFLSPHALGSVLAFAAPHPFVWLRFHAHATFRFFRFGSFVLPVTVLVHVSFVCAPVCLYIAVHTVTPPCYYVPRLLRSTRTCVHAIASRLRLRCVLRWLPGCALVCFLTVCAYVWLSADVSLALRYAFRMLLISLVSLFCDNAPRGWLLFILCAHLPLFAVCLAVAFAFTFVAPRFGFGRTSGVTLRHTHTRCCVRGFILVFMFAFWN